MQEIIASITRLLAEEKRVEPAPIRPAVRDRADILELTEAIGPDGSVRNLAGDRPIGSTGAGEPFPELSAPRSEPELAGGLKGSRPGSDEGRSNLVSSATSEATMAAFARLEAEIGEQHPGLGHGIGPHGLTLEQIVQDTLRPLLQAWLDEHLPALVEGLVQQEIERLVTKARLR